MIKILHTADIHLDSPLKSLGLRNSDLSDAVAAATRSAFSRLVDFSISEGVAAVLISGDLFDGKERSASTGAFLMKELDRLGEAQVRVFYTKGNHDAENPITGALDLPSNVHVFDARGGKEQLAEDIWVHGVSFGDRHAPESLLSRFKAPVEGAFNIAMLHSSLAGAAGHDTYAPCSVADLIGLGFDYWALGHVHKRQVHSQTPWIVMPGIPQGRDIGEAGPKSATLLTIDQGQIAVSEVSSSVVEFVQGHLDVTDVESDEAMRALLRDYLSDIRRGLSSQVGIVRLSLTGRPERYWQILRDRDVWLEQVTELAHAVDDILIDKLLYDLSPPNANATASGATEELAATMAVIRKEQGFVANAREEVEAIMQDLPVALRDKLMPDEAEQSELVDRLTKLGADILLARMKGAEN